MKDPGLKSDETTLWLLRAGVVGPPLFVGISLVEGATRAGYDPLRQFVSLLSLGDGGWLQKTAFLVSGALIVAGGLGMRRASGAGVHSRWTPILVTAGGAGLVIAGLFETDPGQGYPPGAPDGLSMSASWHAALHYAGALLVFGGFSAAAIVLWRRANRAGRAILAVYSLASGLATLGLDLAAVLTASSGGSLAGIAGLLQRAAILAGWSWLTVVSLMLLRSLAPAAVKTQTESLV